MTDAQLLQLVLSIVVEVAVLSAVVVAIRWFTTAKCQVCGLRRISKRGGVDCPRCRQEECRRELGDLEDVPCASCGAPFRETPQVRLWDGRQYCEACVNETLPDLVSKCDESTSLADVLPGRAWTAAAKIFLLVELSGSAVFGSIAFAAIGPMGLLVMQIIILPVAALFAAGAAVGFAWNRPTVFVENGWLCVSRPCSFERFPLKECEWFVGRTSYASPYLSGESVVIALPRTPRQPEVFVAAGFTPETRKIWESFLTLAQIERRRIWEAQTPWMSRLLQTIGIVLVLPAAFAVGLGASWLGAAALEPVLGDRKSAAVVALPLLIPGSAWLVLYAIVLWPWRTPQRSPTGRSPQEQSQIRRNTFIGTVLSSVVVYATPCLLPEKFGVPPTAAIAALAVSVLMAVCVGIDLGRRFALLDQVRKTSEAESKPVAD